MSAAEKVPIAVEQRGADRDASFGKTYAGFLNCDVEHTLMIHVRDFSPRLSLYANLGFMLQEFQAGDFLIFQLEAGYALLRVLDVDVSEADTIWHLTAYRDLFLDTEMADDAIDRAETLGIEIPHAALTNRAFESTQVAKMRNVPLTSAEQAGYHDWKNSPDRHISDRSIRLLLGLR
jgi:hypothetical protein